jgi:hypothetical protein
MDELQIAGLIPLQKQAFVCSAKCCDTHKDMHHLQQCTVNCQQKVQAAHQVLYGTLESFQVRVCGHAQACAAFMPCLCVRSSACRRHKTRICTCCCPRMQERFKRCLMRCEDKAREGLPSSPSEKDIAKAQVCRRWRTAVCWTCRHA